jgi:hypothetical protein
LQLRIGEIERDAEYRLLVRTPPFVREVAHGTELLQTAPGKLVVELAHVPLDR